MLSKTSLGMIAAGFMGAALLGAPALAESSHDQAKPPRLEYAATQQEPAGRLHSQDRAIRRDC